MLAPRKAPAPATATTLASEPASRRKCLPASTVALAPIEAPPLVPSSRTSTEIGRLRVWPMMARAAATEMTLTVEFIVTRMLPPAVTVAPSPM